MKKNTALLLSTLLIFASCQTPSQNPTPGTLHQEDGLVEDDNLLLIGQGLLMKGDPLTITLKELDTVFPDYDCLEVCYCFYTKHPSCDDNNYSNIHLPWIEFDSTLDYIEIFGWNKQWVFQEWNGGWIPTDSIDELEKTSLCSFSSNTSPDIAHRAMLLEIISQVVSQLKKRTFYYEEWEWNVSKNIFGDSTKMTAIANGTVRLR